MVSTQARCDHAPAKLTRISAAVTLTIALCSYHRRQLKRHGHIVDLVDLLPPPPPGNTP